MPSVTAAETLPLSLHRRLVVTALLAVSLVCNILVLFLPFVDLRQGVASEPYSLFRSVGMMWDGGLYVLAGLVVVFSIIFPFAKLGVLAWVASTPTIVGRQRTFLYWVERLGKWSMLDVFLVAIILALTSRQLFVDAEPLVGLSLFIAAILLSMTAGEILSTGLHAPIQAREVARAGGSGWALALAGLALIATITLPFLRIHDWRMLDRSYSVLMLVPVLWIQGAWLAAVLTGVFLVLAPLAVWGASAIAWWQHRGGKIGRAQLRWVPLAHRWSMLDVFGFALTIFALESDSLMRTEVRWGVLALAATLVLQHLFQNALERAQR